MLAPARHPLSRREALSVGEVLDETFIAFHPDVDPGWAGFWSLDDHRGSPPAQMTGDRVANPHETLAALAVRDAITTVPASVARMILNLAERHRRDPARRCRAVGDHARRPSGSPQFGRRRARRVRPAPSPDDGLQARPAALLPRGRRGGADHTRGRPAAHRPAGAHAGDPPARVRPRRRTARTPRARRHAHPAGETFLPKARAAVAMEQEVALAARSLSRAGQGVLEIGFVGPPPTLSAPSCSPRSAPRSRPPSLRCATCPSRGAAPPTGSPRSTSPSATARARRTRMRAHAQGGAAGGRHAGRAPARPAPRAAARGRARGDVRQLSPRRPERVGRLPQPRRPPRRAAAVADRGPCRDLAADARHHDHAAGDHRGPAL